MLADMPAMPEISGELYHIVAMDWWLIWKEYVGFSQVSDTPTGDETTSTAAMTDNDLNGYSDGIQKGHMTQENKESVKKPEKKHPGCINETEGYEKMLH